MKNSGIISYKLLEIGIRNEKENYNNYDSELT